jgi:hypothetical protein
MTKDINMQHMTMKEYVSIAILGELITKESVWESMGKGDTTPLDVVKQSFHWAELWMLAREERNAET